MISILFYTGSDEGPEKKEDPIINEWSVYVLYSISTNCDTDVLIWVLFTVINFNVSQMHSIVASEDDRRLFHFVECMRIKRFCEQTPFWPSSFTFLTRTKLSKFEQSTTKLVVDCSNL